jgi:hypothetical protein
LLILRRRIATLAEAGGSLIEQTMAPPFDTTPGSVTEQFSDT